MSEITGGRWTKALVVILLWAVSASMGQAKVEVLFKHRGQDTIVWVRNISPKRIAIMNSEASIRRAIGAEVNQFDRGKLWLVLRSKKDSEPFSYHLYQYKGRHDLEGKKIRFRVRDIDAEKLGKWEVVEVTAKPGGFEEGKKEKTASR